MTHPVQALGPIEAVWRKARSLAALDAALSPEWQWRYYSYDPVWASGQTMASMRNGSGDHWFIVFVDGVGAGLVGLDHESAAYRRHKGTDALLKSVPLALKSEFIEEPAFQVRQASFGGWALQADAGWSTGDAAATDDGASRLLSTLLGGAAVYKSWAEDYYEVAVDVDAVRAVLGEQPMSEDLARQLGAGSPWPDIRAAVRSSGYPVV